MRRTLLFGVQYRVRVVAVNERGELMAFNHGDLEFIREPGLYSCFRIGATKVTPTRPTP